MSETQKVLLKRLVACLFGGVVLAMMVGTQEGSQDDFGISFHEAVLRATHNELMTSLFSVIETALGGYFQLSASIAGNYSYSLPHHKKVLDAIRRRQPEVARQAMQKMVADSRSNIRRNMRKA